jgi:type IV pilus assembly protein PilB
MVTREKTVNPERRIREKLGEILIRNGIISENQLQRALDFQRHEGGLLGEILVKLGYVNEREIVQALTTQYGFPYLPLESYDINEKAAGIVPENVARQYNAVPLDIMGDLLTIAMSNPLNERAIEDIELITKRKVQVFISTVTSIQEAINRLYRKSAT